MPAPWRWWIWVIHMCWLYHLWQSFSPSWHLTGKTRTINSKGSWDLEVNWGFPAVAKLLTQHRIRLTLWCVFLSVHVSLVSNQSYFYYIDLSSSGTGAASYTGLRFVILLSSRAFYLLPSYWEYIDWLIALEPSPWCFTVSNAVLLELGCFMSCVCLSYMTKNWKSIW